MKEILEIIGVILFVVLMGIMFYMDNVHPYLINTLFNNLKSQFKNVLRGNESYTYFTSHFRATSLQIRPEDPDETVSLKHEINDILNYEDFLRETFTDENISLPQFLNRWRRYGLCEENVCNDKSADNSIPELFDNTTCMAIFDKMVLAGYLEPFTYKWINIYSSYLQAMFADAIGKAINISRNNRWKPFKDLWGDCNYADLFSKAIDSKEVDKLLAAVKQIFPEYTIDEIAKR